MKSDLQYGLMTANNPDKLHFPHILKTSLRHFWPWLIFVLAVSLAGYPTIACFTPFGWLLSARVGQQCTAKSPGLSQDQRLTEAALAGAFFGLLQAVLFIVIAPQLGEIRPEEQAAATWIKLGMLTFGMTATMFLSVLGGWLSERRRKKRNRHDR